MNEFLTWAVPISVALALIGLSYAMLPSASRKGDFWMAGFWFGVGTLVLVIRFTYWALTSGHSLRLRLIICSAVVVILTAITIDAFRSIHDKYNRWAQANLNVPSKSSPLDKASEEIAATIKNISILAEEGNQLLRDGKSTVVNWTKAKDWAARAEDFIKRHVNPESSAYFSFATSKLYPGLAVNREYVNWIYTRVERLGELASDVRAGKSIRVIGSTPNSREIELIDQLIALRDKGHEILRRLSARRTLTPYTKQFEEWKGDVQVYLDTASPGFAKRFSSPLTEYSYPRSTSTRTRNLADELYTRLMRLEGFIRELTK